MWLAITSLLLFLFYLFYSSLSNKWCASRIYIEFQKCINISILKSLSAVNCEFVCLCFHFKSRQTASLKRALSPLDGEENNLVRAKLKRDREEVSVTIPLNTHAKLDTFCHILWYTLFTYERINKMIYLAGRKGQSFVPGSFPASQWSLSSHIRSQWDPGQMSACFFQWNIYKNHSDRKEKSHNCKLPHAVDYLLKFVYICKHSGLTLAGCLPSTIWCFEYWRVRNPASVSFVWVELPRAVERDRGADGLSFDWAATLSLHYDTFRVHVGAE